MIRIGISTARLDARPRVDGDTKIRHQLDEHLAAGDQNDYESNNTYRYLLGNSIFDRSGSSGTGRVQIIDRSQVG